MFAGIGGLELGLERAGMTVKWQVENDPYCQRALAKHWPDVKRHDDVKTFPPKDWTDDELDVNLITAGFPCQDLSVAGKGAGLQGERSGLFYEIIRLAGIIRPKYLLLENVPALLARGMGTVLRELAQVGYDAQWHCIPAASVGAPHRRDRIFIIANANSAGRCEQRRTQPVQAKLASPKCSSWWAIEPGVGRVADGVPRRVDRLKGLGNACVPQVSEFIGRMIVEYVQHNS
jgi:DNA (cytosine-5)-methyltransferase 1